MQYLKDKSNEFERNAVKRNILSERKKLRSLKEMLEIFRPLNELMEAIHPDLTL